MSNSDEKFPWLFIVVVLVMLLVATNWHRMFGENPRKVASEMTVEGEPKGPPNQPKTTAAQKGTLSSTLAETVTTLRNKWEENQKNKPVIETQPEVVLKNPLDIALMEAVVADVTGSMKVQKARSIRAQQEEATKIAQLWREEAKATVDGERILEGEDVPEPATIDQRIAARAGKPVTPKLPPKGYHNVEKGDPTATLRRDPKTGKVQELKGGKWVDVDSTPPPAETTKK